MTEWKCQDCEEWISAQYTRHVHAVRRDRPVNFRPNALELPLRLTAGMETSTYFRDGSEETRRSEETPI